MRLLVRPGRRGTFFEWATRYDRAKSPTRQMEAPPVYRNSKLRGALEAKGRKASTIGVYKYPERTTGRRTATEPWNRRSRPSRAMSGQMTRMRAIAREKRDAIRARSRFGG
jgi:hypothetical protein